LRALRNFLSKQSADSELLILVTHHVTISAITGKAVSSGEGVVLRVRDGGSYDVIGTLDFGL
jgi:hypothetical protein